ncbi:MAG: hypothetical protein K8S27_12080 [Candidatus Omnitrophica bacterium]|nr:hypothetical protein [Candidatus Omnitrophota bacterium]
MDSDKFYSRIVLAGIIILMGMYYLSVKEHKRRNFNPAAYFDNSYQSKHFTFYYNKKIQVVPEFAAFADAFVPFIKNHYFETDIVDPLDFYVLSDREEFRSFIRQELDGIPSDGGEYVYDLRALITHEEADIGTVAYIVMQPLMAGRFRSAPPWFVMGLASFFEMIYVYEDDGQLVLNVGYHSPIRTQELMNRGGIAGIKLSDIVTKPVDQLTKNEVRLVILFLHKRGKLRAYLEQLKENTLDGYNSYLEASFRKELSEIEFYWRHFIVEYDRKKLVIVDNPRSQVFESKELFDSISASFY